MIHKKYPFQIKIYPSYSSQPLKTNEISRIRSPFCEHTDLTTTKQKKFHYLVLNIFSMTMFPVTDFSRGRWKICAFLRCYNKKVVIKNKPKFITATENMKVRSSLESPET